MLFAVLAVVAALSFPGAIWAQASGSESKYKLTGEINAGFFSEYIGGLSGSTAFPHPVFQQSIKATLEPLGFYAKIWNSYSPKGGPNSDFGDEIDYFIGVQRKIGKFSLDVGYVYYDFYKLGHHKGDLQALSLNVDFPDIKGVTPYVNLERDFTVRGGEGGHLYRTGVRHAFEIIGKQALGWEASIAGHDGAYGYKPELVSSARASLFTTFKPWKGKELGISPQLNFQKKLGHSQEGGGIAENKVWGGINVTYSF